nr:MAG TPA: zinc-ribbon domain protein [Bacteriophage sp.]
MSTLIKRIFCNHKWKQMNAITVVCENCGVVRKIPCCHNWKRYTKVNVDDGCSYYSVSTLICNNCGKITQIEDI